MIDVTKVLVKSTAPENEKTDLLAVLLHEGERAPKWVNEACADTGTDPGDFDTWGLSFALMFLADPKSKTSR